MGDMSKHFNREEFACHCGCGGDTVDYQLLVMLEDLRDHFKKPVIISSAFRCLAHNRAVGSSDTSQHVKGKAADVRVAEVRPEDVYIYLISKYPDTCGIGLYDMFVHMDCRPVKARW